MFIKRVEGFASLIVGRRQPCVSWGSVWVGAPKLAPSQIQPCGLLDPRICRNGDHNTPLFLSLRLQNLLILSYSQSSQTLALILDRRFDATRGGAGQYSEGEGERGEREDESGR
jgi:hypothetical protein